MVRKIILAAFLIASGFVSHAQSIIISGVEGNRLLTWADFTGRPDPASKFYANTGWNISYNMPPVKVTSEPVSLKDFTVKLELNPEKSWVKKGRETAELLRHEQGHFDIGRLCQLELVAQLKKALVRPADISSSVGRIFSTTMEKYHQMGLRYDVETNHSINKEAQQKWEVQIAADLKTALPR